VRGRIGEAALGGWVIGAQKIVAKARRLRDAARGWRASAPSDKFDARERAVLAAATDLVGQLIEDATFANLKRHFSEEQIMELGYTIGLWRCTA
jgi:alkylhydroperoxidase family enzyme